MKKVIFILIVLISAISWSQKGSGFGLKAGLNYNSNGEFINDSENIAEDPSKKIGFHLGVYGKIDLGGLYIRPEAIYTKTSSEYNSGDLSISKLDVPLLLGIDIVGPLAVFAGPSLQYILKNDFEDFSLEDANDKFTVGAQFGVGLNFKRIGLDLRYERGLSKNEVEFTDLNQNRVDTRPDQLILGASLKL
jgi:hypothetical protein